MFVIQAAALRYWHIATKHLIGHEDELNGKPWLVGMWLQTIENNVDFSSVFIVAEVR